MNKIFLHIYLNNLYIHTCIMVYNTFSYFKKRDVFTSLNGNSLSFTFIS